MKKSLFIIISVFLAMPLFAAYNKIGIPDSSEIRAGLEEKWFTAPLSAVRENPPGRCP